MQRIKAFYTKELSKTDDAFDILYIGISILENDFIDVKTWAKELFMLSLTKADNASDFFDILQIITSQKCFDDKNWTINLFHFALQKVKTRTSLKFIADCIDDEYYIGDTHKAEIIYKYCSTKLWTFSDPILFLPKLHQELYNDALKV